MRFWIVITIIIEAMAVIGMLFVIKTKQTKFAFATGFNTMLFVTIVYILSFPPFTIRHLLIFSMVVVYLLHINWLLLFHGLHTAMPKLDRIISPTEKFILPILLANTVGWGYCLPFYFAAKNHAPLGMVDGIAFLVYVLGSIFHFGSDYQKLRFKMNPDSQGKLLTTGFWATSRHPNYFGDFLIYVAFAILGRNVLGWVSPLINFIQYRLDAIPKNEEWAQRRYGKQWEEYKKRVKMFIPYLY